MDDTFDFGKRKKKKVVSIKESEEDTDKQTYMQNLKAVYDQMVADGIERNGSIKLPIPNIYNEKKKTIFVNAKHISNVLSRPLESIRKYIISEFRTSVDIDSNDCLILKGRFTQSQIESMIKMYVRLYVECRACKGVDTEMRKIRSLDVITCNRCHATTTS